MLLAAQKLDVVRIEYNHLKIYYIDLLYHIDVVRNNSERWQKMTLFNWLLLLQRSLVW